MSKNLMAIGIIVPTLCFAALLVWNPRLRAWVKSRLQGQEQSVGSFNIVGFSFASASILSVFAGHPDSAVVLAIGTLVAVLRGVDIELIRELSKGRPDA
jgi:hypothetical protein